MTPFRFMQTLTCLGAVLAATSSLLYFKDLSNRVRKERGSCKTICTRKTDDFGAHCQSQLADSCRSDECPPSRVGEEERRRGALKGQFCGDGEFCNCLETPNPELLFASNTYLGPTKPIPGNPKLIRIEVLVRDSSDPSGPQVVEVEFNKSNIPLKPRDIYGNRGSGSFQLPPGKYKLRWKTNQDKVAWPRKVAHEEEVTLSPRDLWIQIQIEGEEATIN